MIRFVERELTPTETLLKDAGFAAYGAEFGDPPPAAVKPCIVAVDGTTFAGFAMGRSSNSRRWFYLSDLYVEAAYRKQGLGRRLLEAIEAAAIDLGAEKIWVWTAAYQAPGFYQKYGYTVFAEMDGWYANGSARIGLWKALPAPVIYDSSSSSSSGTVDGGS